jgi:hypothetical protein
VNGRIRGINQILEEKAPPEIDGAVKDELHNISDNIVKEVRQGMLPEEVMRRNPARAVQHHMDWSDANKKKIMAWKNIQTVLYRDSDDPDLRNFEQHRPAMTMGGPSSTSTFMPDAQIGGHMALSEQAKANYPDSMGQDVNSALAQVLESADSIDDPEIDEMLAQFEEEAKSDTKEE